MPEKIGGTIGYFIGSAFLFVLLFLFLGAQMKGAERGEIVTFVLVTMLSVKGARAAANDLSEIWGLK